MNGKTIRTLFTGTVGLTILLGNIGYSQAKINPTPSTLDSAELAGSHVSLTHLASQEFIYEPFLLAQQQQQSKVALIIGNSDYDGAPLENPINDATAIHQTLDDLGFDMLPLVTNANKQEMVEAIRDFQDRLEDSAVGVFYYAGHGVQVKGINYLVPTEADLEREAEAEFEAIDLDRVIAAMNAANTEFNVLIIDACRDNPFYRRWPQTRGSHIRGLTNNRPPSGTLIAYATEPNDVAEDGGDGSQHSPYTRSLLTHLRTPGISIFDMLTLVTEDVFEATNAQQSPYFEGTLRGFFSFNPSDSVSNIALDMDLESDDTSQTDLPSSEAEEGLTRLNFEAALARNAAFGESLTNIFNERLLALDNLKSLTQANNWEAADSETTRLLLQLGDTNENGSLSQAEVESLPCSALKEIDQVWVDASDGRFGFSVQARILQEAASATGEDSYGFSSRIGWYVDQQWINYDDVLFDTNAPMGHLPATVLSPVAPGLTGQSPMTLFDNAQRLTQLRNRVSLFHCVI